VKSEVGCVDVLINNAGVVSGHKILDCSEAMMRKTMDVNVTAHFWVSQHFVSYVAHFDGHFLGIFV